MSLIQDHRDMDLWKAVIRLDELICKITDVLPAVEKFGLVSQMRRAATSIQSNIAEGYRQFHQAAYRRYIEIAFGSASELEAQLASAKRRYALPWQAINEADRTMTRVAQMLNKLRQSLA